jgi:hypothetical protein
VMMEGNLINDLRAETSFTKRLPLHRPEPWYRSDRSGLSTVRTGC